MKLAATSRRGKVKEISFHGDTAALKALMDEEILVYLRYDAVVTPYIPENQSIFMIR